MAETLRQAVNRQLCLITMHQRKGRGRKKVRSAGKSLDARQREPSEVARGSAGDGLWVMDRWQFGGRGEQHRVKQDSAAVRREDPHS